MKRSKLIKKRSRKKKDVLIKAFSLLLALTLFLVIITAYYSTKAEERPLIMYDIESEESLEEIIKIDEGLKEDYSIPTSAAGFKVTGKSSLLMTALDGKVLYENNADEKLSIASVTKIMTMLLVSEQIDSGLLSLDQTLVTSAYAESMGGSQIWLSEGETMTVSDLLKAVAVVSANDASVVLAEAISGNEEQFVKKMNERAEQLGMKNTLFKDSNGLDDSGYSTARDIALMSRELLKYDLIIKYTSIWMDVLRGGKSQLVNTNRLIRFYDGATGLKTGTTSKSGHCLSGSAQRDGLELIAVVLGCSTTEERFTSVRQMLDFGFANYAVFNPTLETSNLKNVKVKNGTEDFAVSKVENPESIIIPRGKESEITQEWIFEDFLNAPVLQNQQIGRVVFKYQDKMLSEFKIFAEKEVPKMTFGKALKKLLTALVS